MNHVAKLIMAFAVLALTACNDDTTTNHDTQPTTRIVFGGPDRPAALASVNAYSLQGVERLGIRVVEVPTEEADRIIQELASDPDVQFVEVDQLLYPGFVPNDPRYPEQWHLLKINAAEAWHGGSGEGQVIAILDTGVDTNHQEIIGRTLPGTNIVDGSSDVSDVHGHGTAVAGTAAAITGNGLDIASIAWGAEILPVKITNQENGGAWTSDMAAAMVWAVDNGADIINLSYNNVYRSVSTTSAAEYVKGRGGIVVVASGNDGSGDECGWPFDPSNPSMVIVGASTFEDTKAIWGTCGPQLDVSAPGQGILTLRSGGGVHRVSGTSFSSPLTAGLLATMWSANPALSNDELIQAMLDTVVDLGDPGFDNVYGYGRIDAAAAMARVLSTVPAPDPEPTPEPDPTPEPAPDPAVAIDLVSPYDGAVVSGRFDLLMVAAGESPVMVFRCYLNNTLLRERSFPRDQRDQPVVCGISTKRWPNGTYTATAEVEDETGATATASVTVIVQN